MRLTDLRYAITDLELRRTWRCRIGLHRPAFYGDYHSYGEPPEPYWHCEECGHDAIPLRDRPWLWFYETRLGEWFIEWDFKRRYPDD